MVTFTLMRESCDSSSRVMEAVGGGEVVKLEEERSTMCSQMHRALVCCEPGTEASQ
jgi:hypothetical protein